MTVYLEKVAKWLKRIIVIVVALFVVVGLGIGVVDKISAKIEERENMDKLALAEKEEFVAFIDDFDNEIKNTGYSDGVLDKDKLLEANAVNEIYSGIGSYEYDYIYQFINYEILEDYIYNDLVNDCWIDAFCNEEYCDITRAILYRNYLYTNDYFDTLIKNRDGIKLMYNIVEDEDTGFWLKSYIITDLYGWFVRDIESLNMKNDNRFKVAKRVLDKEKLEGYMLEVLAEASDYDEMKACLQVFDDVYDEYMVKIFTPYIENPNDYEAYKVHAIISQLKAEYSNKHEVSYDLKLLYDKAMKYVSEEVENMELSEDTIDIYSTYIDMVYKDVSWENAEIVFDKAFDLDKANVYSKQVMLSYIEIIFRHNEVLINRLKDHESLKSEDINKIIRFINLAYEYNFLEYSFDDIKLHLLSAILDYENKELLEKLKYVSREVSYENGYIIAKGDFDGDGLDDVSKVHMYVLDGVGNKLEIRLGNGASLDYNFNQDEIGYGYEFSLCFKDLNNDGMDELVICSSFVKNDEYVYFIKVFDKNNNEYSQISSECLTDWENQDILDINEISPYLMDDKTEWNM